LSSTKKTRRAKNAIEPTNPEINLFFQNSLDMMILIGFDNRIKQVSPSFEKILGWEKEEVISKSFQDFLHPDDRESSLAKAKAQETGEDAVRFENRYRCKEGGYRWISWNSHPLPEKQIIVGIGRDITELKKAEEALKASEQKANDLIKYAPSGIYELDYRIPPKFRSVNDAMCEILGYTRDELLATSPFALLDDESRIRFRERILKMQADEKVDETVEFKVIAKNGREIYAILNTTFTYKDGKPDGALVIAQDVTKLKKAEIAFEERTKNLERLVEERTRKLELASLYTRSLIEASLDPLVTISKEGKITDVNKATEKVTGCTREELIGSDFSDYFTEPEKARAGYQKVFTEGSVKDYPLVVRHKCGELTDVLYNAAIYRNNIGEVQGVFAAARDITERKKAEEEAKENARKLKDAERLAAIGATAGMVGHDIRNPLQAITSDVYLLKDSLESMPEMPTKKDVAESLEGIEKNVDYINKIVQDLQDYARPIIPSSNEIELAILFEEVTLKMAIPEKIEAFYQIEKGAEKLITDSALLKRILANLVNNAVQTMPNGGKLTICAHKEANSEVITIKDTGVGIPEEVKPKLFTPMVTTKSKGQGFGLAVVKRMTDALGGTVSFESQEGKGTTFTIRLPIKS
jgi:chemotaxis family two-component system sensor kinase Cph1